jgi:hypothetical protein
MLLQAFQSLQGPLLVPVLRKRERHLETCLDADQGSILFVAACLNRLAFIQRRCVYISIRVAYIGDDTYSKKQVKASRTLQEPRR